MTAVLKVDCIGATFGSLRAVRDVTLQAHAGERLIILGTNGAGKSTLFNLIAGDILPTYGSIEWRGQPIQKLSAHERTRLGISRSYQTSRVLHGLSVADNMYLAVQGVHAGRFSWRVPGADHPWRKKAADTLSRIGLRDVGDELASNLSHGEQRQLEIAMALASDPYMLLLDEPAAGLSPSERPGLVALLRGLSRDVTMIMIEHDMDVALQVADRVLVMHEGEIMFEGTPEETAASPLVRSLYLGSSGDVDAA
ncbi:ABC transporter ATP-binding protein [Alcaligenaceae bacterium]|nr:ABC transporter ATP-binding protein [Alcaligenaceae bacterium]